MDEKEKRTETIAVKTTETIVKAIDQLAKEHEWTRSKTAEKLIQLALEKNLI